MEALDDGFLIGVHVLDQAACRLAQGKVGNQLLQQGLLGHGFLVTALGVARDFLQLLFAAVEVGEDQLKVDDLDIALRVNAVGNVNHVFVFEAAHYVSDGIGFTDVGQKLVAQAFAFRCASHQACDIDEFHGGRQDALRLDDGSQCVQTWVGHRHDTGVRLDRAEGEVLGRDTGFGKGVEQGGLADVRQADDAAVESHGVSPRIKSQAFWLCRFFIARFHSPARISGSTPRAKSMLASSFSCSARGARPRTKLDTMLATPGWPMPSRRR